MRPWILAIILVALIPFLFVQPDFVVPETTDVPEVLTGEVLLVRDGDSFCLYSGSERYEIDLFGIDAPEMSQTFGDHARYYLFETVKSHTVRVEVLEKDPAGIILGELYVDQISINQLMLKDGYAWASVESGAN
jgi:endonuclease YncB( thermonuclease family)